MGELGAGFPNLIVGRWSELFGPEILEVRIRSATLAPTLAACKVGLRPLRYAHTRKGGAGRRLRWRRLTSAGMWVDLGPGVFPAPGGGGKHRLLRWRSCDGPRTTASARSPAAASGPAPLWCAVRPFSSAGSEQLSLPQPSATPGSKLAAPSYGLRERRCARRSPHHSSSP